MQPWLLALAWSLVLPAPATAVAAEAPEAKRPRIGLVLGGGGARGAAHVGVLKVLEELRIPVDYVAGTSMGSIVGGLYASGMNPQEIDQEMRAMDWGELFQDAPDRADRSFRRKRDDELYAFKAKPGFNDGKIEIPLAYIRGHNYDLEQTPMTLPEADIKDFNRLPIPYRAVATDLETGKEAVLASGSLAKAIRASMAVPAAFDPVEIDDRLLVDGGLANNVPISVARDMGAEVLIVVDVGSGLLSREKMTSGLCVTGQLAAFLFTLNTEQQLKSLGARDVLMRPPLGDIGGGSFDLVPEAIPTGERAARDAIDALRRYSLDPEAYARHLAKRGRPVTAAPVIDFIRIDNRSRLGDAVIAERISAKPGQPLDIKQLEQDIGYVYGLENFESVRYDVVRENGRTGLVITATEKHWGPGYLQFGLALANNWDGDNTYQFGVLYTKTGINTLNGEWRVGAQFGDEATAFTEIYQPVEALSHWFVTGKIGFDRDNISVFVAAGNMLARYRADVGGLELGVGREFGTWGEGRLGYRRGTGTAEVGIGSPAPDLDVDRGELFLRLSDDRLDNLYFPREGHAGLVEYSAARDDLGASTDYDQVLLKYLHSFSWGDNTLIGVLTGASTLDDNAPLEALFELGGFLRLSGLQPDQLSGQEMGLGELIYMRRLLKTQYLQFFQSYLGASIELGNVWQRSSDASFDNTIVAGSVFLGMDTPVGPLYLAYGRTDTDNSSVYLYLGPQFKLSGR